MLNERGATCWGGVCAFPHHDWHALPCSFATAASAPAIRLAHVPLTIVYWLKYQYASPQRESARSLKSVNGPHMKKDNVTAGHRGETLTPVLRTGSAHPTDSANVAQNDPSHRGETGSEARRHLGKGPDVHSCSVNATKLQTSYNLSFCAILVNYIWLWKTLHLPAS